MKDSATEARNNDCLPTYNLGSNPDGAQPLHSLATFVVITKKKKRLKMLGESPGLVVMGVDSVLKVVGSNPRTMY